MMEERHFGPVWFIPGENRGRYPFCHSVYVDGPGVLIDPASNRDLLIQLRKSRSVKMIWLSHWHEDHWMHLDLFDDLPFWVSDKDALPLSNLEVFLDCYGMDREQYREYWRHVLKEQFHFKPRRPERFLHGGQIIDLGVQTVKVISTPGHTPGHLAFLFQESEVLLIGDYDLSRFGPWYGDAYSSIEETIESITHLRKIPAKVLIASHENGIFTEEPGKRWDDYLDIIQAREEKLLELLTKPRTLDEIVEAWIIYGRPREPKAFYEFGERAHMKKHLERFVKLGEVLKEKDRYIKTG
jgi:glyoxylase-like metal-dependent hydrolase (beta-lactamase superfamily II)